MKNLKERLILLAAALVARDLPKLASTAREAAEVIAAMPYAADINRALYPEDEQESGSPLLMGGIEDIRAMREWHWRQAQSYRTRAVEAESKSMKRVMVRSGGSDEFQRLAHKYHAEANQHLRFVQTLNAFFPREERVC